MPTTIDAFDWAKTPLGHKDGWSPALRTTYDIMQTAHVAMCATWGAERTLIYNAAYIPFLADRHPGALGQPIDVVWHDVWDDIRPLIDKAMAGEPVHFEDMPLRMTRKGFEEDTWWTFSYSPIRDGQTVMGILDIAFETTARVQQEQIRAETEARLREAVAQRTLLAHELDHRVKNILAMVTAIAHQTFRKPATMETAPGAFSSRLRALAKAQDILTRTNWTGASVEEIAAGALDNGLALGGRVRAAGPAIDLSAKAGLALALALHELATNSIKYGALSVEEGRVDLHWEIENERGNDSFLLRWIESGGPLVTEPQRRGFGTRLITSALSAEFRGIADISYLSEGVRFTLKAPYPFTESV